MIIYSSDYYRDRANIIQKHFDRFHVSNLRERKILNEDLFKLNQLNDFFKERDINDFDDYYHERTGIRSRFK